MKAKIFTLRGEVKTDVTLPKEYVKTSAEPLLAQAIRVYEDRTHFGLSRVKTRSEVNISRKKIYKQKGTGGARHGAKSAHIFVGGGVVHGPTGMKRNLVLPVRMKKKALTIALSNKFAANQAVLVEGMSKISKTAEASNTVESIKKVLGVKSKVLVVSKNEEVKMFKFFKNIKNVDVVKFKDLNAFLVLRKSLILIDSLNFEIKREIKVKDKDKTKSTKKAKK